jgi:drug/metabolite transporter (DMT)-like permease
VSFVVPFAWRTPSPIHWPLFVLVAALGGVAHYAMIRALQLAPAAVIQPFSYTLLLWAVVIGYLGFGDLPDGWTLLGASAIVGAGLYTAVREHRLRRGVGLAR